MGENFGLFKSFGDRLFEGETPTNLGLIGSVNISPLLLDAYPNAAVAYSLRSLRSTYTGNAIRVRRTSDNTEQDIGFASGNLDTISLLAFCGVSNGFVTTWYDQSGNANNVVQTTAANQAQIVSSGSVILQNSKPTMLFDGVNDSFLSTVAVDPLFITAVNSPNTTGVYKTLMGADASGVTAAGSIYFQYSDLTRNATFSRKTSVDSGGASDFQARSITSELNNVMNLMTGTRTSTVIQVFTNNALKGSDTTTNPLASLGGTDNGKFRLMAGYFSSAVTDFLQGNLSEFVAYTSDQSSNRTGINTDINTYYAIY
jgi:hypothetical protein